MTHFITLCRGVLLFPQISLALLHIRNYVSIHTSICTRPELKTSQSLDFFTLYSTLLHWTGLQPRSNSIPTETLEPSSCRTRWGLYGLPPTVVARGNTARLSCLKIYRIKKVLADLSVPFQNLWSARSIRRLESLTTLLLILGVLSQYNEISTNMIFIMHHNHDSIVHHNVVHFIFLENSILLLYAGDITLKSIWYKIINYMQVNLPPDCKVMQSAFL
jgi:hypothetical protein